MILLQALVSIVIIFLFGVFWLFPFYLAWQVYLALATTIKPRLSTGWMIGLAVFWVFAIAFFLPMGPPFLDIPLVTLFGWTVGLWRFVSGFRFEPLALGVGLVSAVLFFVTLHLLVRGIVKPYGKSWKTTQTVCVAGITTAVCIAGIALLAGIHELYWAATTKERWFNSGGMIAARRMQTQNMVRQLVIGFHNYHDTYVDRSPGGTFLPDGRLGHSWETQLLPFVEESNLYETISFDKPWTDPANRPAMEIVLPPFRSLHVSLDKHRNADGYGLSYFAVNERLLPVGATRSILQIPDGASNTILLGEVKGNVRAWGDPVNARDPALGINTSPYGFGGFSPGGALVGLADGTVRFLDDTIAPEVLRALATPDGGEDVHP